MNRRNFVLGAGAAAHAVTGSRAHAQSKARTAVIGTGNRGSYLLQGVLEQADAAVTALCDIKGDRLDRAATSARRDNPKTYSDWRQVMERDDIDVVFIATPPHLHSEMAIAALKRGKHVYCEKPIGVTAAQVKSVVEAARASSRVFVSGQQLRSIQRLAQTVRKIHDGIIGDVIMIKAQRHATADLPHDGTSGDWYFDVSKSGGYLIEQSVHNLDLCNWVAGAHPLRATGLGGIVFYRNQPPGRTIYDCGSITYEYPKGVKMSFTQNVFHPRGMPGGGQYLYVYGTKGAVDLMSAQPMMYPLGQGEAPAALADQGPKENPHAHIAAFYGCVAGGSSNPADITIGATAALTAILGHEAMVKENTVRWDDLGVKL